MQFSHYFFVATLIHIGYSIILQSLSHHEYVFCNTPVLTPFALNIYDVYIVINRGVELKGKAPPLIWLCYVSAIGIIVGGISCYPAPYSFGIM